MAQEELGLSRVLGSESTDAEAGSALAGQVGNLLPGWRSPGGLSTTHLHQLLSWGFASPMGRMKPLRARVSQAGKGSTRIGTQCPLCVRHP